MQHLINLEIKENVWWIKCVSKFKQFALKASIYDTARIYVMFAGNVVSQTRGSIEKK